MEIRTRFAPSPTGFLHIGGLRTALYNFLFAKKYNGKFILRIEDTDQGRIIPESIGNLLSIIKICGLAYDEGPQKNGKFGPYIQSHRLKIYGKKILELIENKLAYPCFFSVDDKDNLSSEFNVSNALERMKNETYVVKFKLKSNKTLSTYDEIRGNIVFDLNLIEDPIIFKSDGYPTYHFANVIDDHYMKISHVIRGEEWLPSLPKHILLYKAFKWEHPKFCHLPLLLNSDKSKLSKRQGDVAVEDFLNKGYMKESLINFVALLGWHPDDNQEIFSLEELIESFSIERINKSGAIFDIEKLNWMNKIYLKNVKQSDLISPIKLLLQKQKINIPDNSTLEKMINFAKVRVNTINEIIDEIQCFLNYDKVDDKLLEIYNIKSLGKLWYSKLESIKAIDELHIKNIIGVFFK